MKSYFTFPSVTTITDSLVTMETEFLRDHIPPDTTICNLNPFRSDYRGIMEKEHLPTLKDYLARVESFKEYSQYFYNVQDKLHSLMGYYQFIGLENAAKLSHLADDFIIDCNMVGFGILGFQMLPCNRTTQIKQYMTPGYYSCYTITFDPKTIEKANSLGFFILGIEVILHVDNTITGSDEYFLQKNSAAGVAVGKKCSLRSAHFLKHPTRH